MAYPVYTYELKISFSETLVNPETTKHDVQEWLAARGIDEFVEGMMDGLDIDHEYTGANDRDFYKELGGDRLPLSVFKYSKELVDDLALQIKKDFGDKISVNVSASETKEWLEGWKTSFRPIQTEFFYIYPPWDESKKPQGKYAIVIEPGMAFGTGQHATTQLCLARLEKFLIDGGSLLPVKRLCDVGTGTGILAIAAQRMGFASVAATDIDPDAITAARNNSDLNGVRLALWQGGVPRDAVCDLPELKPPFDVVVANILFVVLEKLIKDLTRVLAPQGVLILSGILNEDAVTMIELAKREGLEFSDETQLDGWSCLTLTRSRA